MGGYIGARAGVGLVNTTLGSVQDLTATDASPEVTLINNTHEDSDGGRKGKVIFKGQQSGGEESTLAEIEANHLGSSDDEKGQLVFRTNDGSDGSSPTERLRIDSNGSILTATLGTDTVKLGDGAGESIASGGNNNTLIGHDAGKSITTGTVNTFVGNLAGDAVTTSHHNTGVGHQALTTNVLGSNSVAVGSFALNSQNPASASDIENTAVGYNAGSSITTADRSVLIGALTGDAITTGGGNTAVGYSAMGAATTADLSTCVGYQAGQNITTGARNNLFGVNAGQSLTTGASNTFIGGASTGSGNGAGKAVTTGSKNTILGTYDGNQDNLDIRTSDNQIVISNGDGNVRIFSNSEGYTKFKPVSSGHYSSGGAYHEFDHNNNDTSMIIYYQQHASYVQAIQFTQAQRVASSNYFFQQHRSGAGSDIEFNIRGDGNAYADGSWNGGGADYAEYFEWADGNSSNQDRTGYTVVLDNEKIRLATSDDAAANIIGAVSVNPSVVGDADIDQWKHKYQRDDFGGFVWETYTVTEWKEGEVLHSYETDKIPDGVTAPDDATVSTEDANENTLKRKVLNSDYNPDAAYVSREDRQEWATIGMMGKLRIRKGQPTGDRWIKMRDISETVEEWLVR